MGVGGWVQGAAVRPARPTPATIPRHGTGSVHDAGGAGMTGMGTLPGGAPSPLRQANVWRSGDSGVADGSVAMSLSVSSGGCVFLCPSPPAHMLCTSASPPLTFRIPTLASPTPSVHTHTHTHIHIHMLVPRSWVACTSPTAWFLARLQQSSDQLPTPVASSPPLLPLRPPPARARVCVSVCLSLSAGVRDGELCLCCHSFSALPLPFLRPSKFLFSVNHAERRAALPLQTRTRTLGGTRAYIHISAPQE